MKFTLSVGLILLSSTLFSINGNAQTDSQLQPSPQPTCVAVKPSESSTTRSKLPATQRSIQVQQRSECALTPQPQPVQREPRLSERDRLIKERFEQRIIPPQDQTGENP
jgi:hypothetical protein